MVFWKDKQKKQNNIDVRAMAMGIKSSANAIVQDFTKEVTLDELTTLIALISYMDKFLLKCMKGDKIINKRWISDVLIKAIRKLAKSKKSLIQDITYRTAELEYEIRISGEKKDDKRD